MLNKNRFFLPLAIGALLLVGAGCGKAEVTVNANSSTEGQAKMEKPPRQLEVELGALGSAGLSGKAVLIEENEKTRVMINLSGEASATARPAHIHAGACPTPGKVLYPLADVVSGKSVTVLDARFDDMLASGELALNVHRSVSDLGVYLSCGDLLLTKVMDKEAGIEAMMQADTEAKADGGEVKTDTNLNVNVNANLNVNVGTVAATKVIKVTANNFSFTPSEIRVKLGEKIRLEIASIDVDHGIALPAFNLNAALKTGTTTKLEFTADKKGSYPFFCNVFCGSGHKNMTGTLIVE